MIFEEIKFYFFRGWRKRNGNGIRYIWECFFFGIKNSYRVMWVLRKSESYWIFIKSKEIIEKL